MKIVLVNPPTVYNAGEEPFIVFPLGLGYIAAVLRHHDMSILDCIAYNPIKRKKGRQYIFGTSYRDIESYLQREKPRTVLISSNYSFQFEIVRSIVKIIKKTDANAIIIAGGNNVTAEPERYLDCGINYAILGEGEKSAKELLDCIENDKQPGRISGIAFKDGHLFTTEKSWITDLDELPHPARDLFDMEYYMTASNKHTLIKNSSRVAEVLTSRGCPYGCSFCASSITSGTKYRSRSVPDVIREIKHLIDFYGADEIQFVDDNLMLDINRFKDLCNEIKELGIRWTMPNGLTLKNIKNRSMLKLMQESGCYAIYLPIESINKTARKEFNNKAVPTKVIRHIVRDASSLGLYTVGFCMIGFYEETKQEILKTVKFASKIGLDEAHFSIVTPIKGTTYYKKYYTGTQERYRSAKIPGNTLHLTAYELSRLRNYAYSVFEMKKLLNRPFSYIDKIQMSRLGRYLRFLANSR